MYAERARHTQAAPQQAARSAVQSSGAAAETAAKTAARKTALSLSDEVTRALHQARSRGEVTGAQYGELAKLAEKVRAKAKRSEDGERRFPGILGPAAAGPPRTPWWETRSSNRSALDAAGRLAAHLKKVQQLDPELAGALRSAEELHRRLRAAGRARPAQRARTMAEKERPFTIRPVARLDVATPPHGRVQTNGLAQLFPARHVHAQGSSAVVAANNCKLEAFQHYHVRRVSLSYGRLATDAGARAALREAVAAPGDEARLDAFHAELRRLADPAPEPGSDRITLPVRARHFTTIADADAVQLGDGSTMRVSHRYVVDETRLSVVDLLADDRALTGKFVAALAEPQPGAATGELLTGLLAAGRGVGDRELLDRSTGLPRAGADVFSLFGLATVNRADAVMIGSGNTLRTSARVHRPDLGRAWLADGLSEFDRPPRPRRAADQPGTER